MNRWLSANLAFAVMAAASAAFAGAPGVLMGETDQPAISVSTPREISTSSIGIIPAAELELPETLWKDLSAAELSILLKSLTGGVASSSLRGLIVRSLAASAELPDGDEDLLADRAEALLALGQSNLAGELLTRVPKSQRSPRQEQLSFLLAAISTEAPLQHCKTAEDNLSRYTSPFWQRWVVLCHAKEGEADKAQLGLDLLSEQNEFSEFFQKLARSLLEKKPLVKLPEVVFLEQAVWLHFATERHYLAQQKNPPLAVVGVSPPETLPEAWKESAQRYGVYQASLKVPQSESFQPDLSGLRLSASADAAKKRIAFLTYGLRKALDLPVSLEAEQELSAAYYRAGGIVLSPAWRDALSDAATKGQAGRVTLLLAGMITSDLRDYAPADLALATQALLQSGLEKDASLFAREVMQAAKLAAAKE